jgi:ubiquinone/menaquinone biosynthesis C-methylase UbiE
MRLPEQLEERQVDAGYEQLARREAEHWGAAGHDPLNPQIWDDPGLQEIFFGAEERHFLKRAVAIGPRVLELGCGEGDLAWDLAGRGLDVTGIDLSPKRIQAAAARVNADAVAARVAPATSPASPRFVVGDLNTMELPDGPFDGAIAHDALHHIVELDALFTRLERVLRPGGTLLVLDFAGMGRAARMLSAALVAVLPTYMPYARKWGLRRRLGAFLASERDKRAALERGTGGVLHDQSPFEGISQESIVPAIERRFEIIEYRSFLPFWWYLAPKLRLGAHRDALARRFRAWDDGLLRSGLARGSYFIVEARRRVQAP